MSPPSAGKPWAQDALTDEAVAAKLTPALLVVRFRRDIRCGDARGRPASAREAWANSALIQEKAATLVHRLATSFCAFALAVVFAAGAAPSAAAQEVDLQLVLAVDVSGSVSDERFLLQKQGYARAFRHWRVLEAIRAGSNGAIAVTMTHWTGATEQMQVVPWMVIKDEASMLAFADAVEHAQRQLYAGGTSISGAIDHAMTLFPQIKALGGRRVIDISGDGANNRGRPAADARDDAVRAGVTINGLPILAVEPNLDQYYLNNVIGGPNAFSIVAENFEAFEEAVLRKLITEIAALRLERRVAAIATASGS